MCFAHSPFFGLLRTFSLSVELANRRLAAGNRSAGGSSKAAATAAAAPQQTGSPDDEVLLNFLKLMRASKLAERERVRAQLELLEVDLQQVRSCPQLPHACLLSTKQPAFFPCLFCLSVKGCIW